jgi:hypothetical protein
VEEESAIEENLKEHQSSGFCYTIVSTVDSYCKPPVAVYRGEDCVDTFLEYLVTDEQMISEVLKHVEPMIITPEQKQAFQEESVCHICKFDLVQGCCTQRVQSKFQIYGKNTRRFAQSAGL